MQEKQLLNSQTINVTNLLKVQVKTITVNNLIILDNYLSFYDNLNTRTSIKSILQKYIIFISLLDITISEIQYEQVQSYKLFINNKYSVSSARRIYSVINHFNSHCFESGIINKKLCMRIHRNNIGFKTFSFENNFFVLEEYNLLVNFIKETFRDKAIRFLIIVDLFFYTGMRRFELINAKYGDISITKNRSCFINVTGKCSITGTIPLPIHILHRVNEYYHYLKIKPTLDTPLILNGDLQKYTNKQLNNIIRELLDYFADVYDQPKFKNMNCHSFRHSYATYLYDQKLSLKHISQNLRHTSISTSIHYIHLNKDYQYYETVTKFPCNLLKNQHPYMYSANP